MASRSELMVWDFGHNLESVASREPSVRSKSDANLHPLRFPTTDERHRHDDRAEFSTGNSMIPPLSRKDR
jgi:hypothetical protein